MAKLKEGLRRLDWGNHLLNFLATLFGVLLAFYLTNYQENRRDHQRLKAAKENILTEIKDNEKNAQNHLAETTKILATLTAFKKFVTDQAQIVGTEVQVNGFRKSFPDFFKVEDKKQIHDDLFEWEGSFSLNMNYLNVSDIAWQNAQAMDVLHLMDYGTTTALYSMYRYQNDVVSDAAKAIDMIKNMSNYNDDEGFRVIFKDFKGQLELLVQLETGLTANYAGILKTLEKK